MKIKVIKNRISYSNYSTVVLKKRSPLIKILSTTIVLSLASVAGLYYINGNEELKKKIPQLASWTDGLFSEFPFSYIFNGYDKNKSSTTYKPDKGETIQKSVKIKEFDNITLPLTTKKDNIITNGDKSNLLALDDKSTLKSKSANKNSFTLNLKGEDKETKTLIETYNKLSAKLDTDNIDDGIYKDYISFSKALDSYTSNLESRIKSTIPTNNLDKESQSIALSIEAKAQELKREFRDEKYSLIQSHKEELKMRLEQQKSTLNRWFEREGRRIVDKERNGRLENITDLTKMNNLVINAGLANHAYYNELENVHKLQMGYNALKTAFSNPDTPFIVEFERMLNNSIRFELSSEVAQTLNRKIIRSGLPSYQSLSSEFEKLKKEINMVALVEENTGIIPHLVSALFSFVTFSSPKSLSLDNGDSVGDVLMKTEYFLENDQLELAARQLNTLKGWPKQISADWLKTVRSKLEFEQALKVIEKELLLNNIVMN